MKNEFYYKRNGLKPIDNFSPPCIYVYIRPRLKIDELSKGKQVIYSFTADTYVFNDNVILIHDDVALRQRKWRDVHTTVSFLLFVTIFILEKWGNMDSEEVKGKCEKKRVNGRKVFINSMSDLKFLCKHCSIFSWLILSGFILPRWFLSSCLSISFIIIIIINPWFVHLFVFLFCFFFPFSFSSLFLRTLCFLSRSFLKKDVKLNVSVTLYD